MRPASAVCLFEAAPTILWAEAYYSMGGNPLHTPYYYYKGPGQRALLLYGMNFIPVAGPVANSLPI